MPLFWLDTPVGETLGRVSEFAGWYLPDDGSPDFGLELRLDGRPYAGLLRAQRPDVGAAHPEFPLAAACGFRGDLALPADVRRGATVRVEIHATLAGGSTRKLLDQRYAVVEDPASPSPRPRAFHLEEILRPLPGLRLEIEGVPHFHPEGVLPCVRLTQRGVTHPYGDMARELIAASRGLVLDHGAGVKPRRELREHVVLLDIIHFPRVDVVSSHRELPFRDGVFDLVVSQAVFEHLPDPFFTAGELRRVLRPGGVALVDTAFLQPFHGDPSHYFNMTRQGLREVMKGFEIEELGVQSYQYPSVGWIMQAEAALALIAAGPWRDRVTALLEALKSSGGDLDRDLGAVGRDVLATGVFVRARKPI